MTYKNIDEVLRNCVHTAIQQYVEETVDWQNNLGPEFIPVGRFKDIEDKVVKDIMQSDYINIKFKGEK